MKNIKIWEGLNKNNQWHADFYENLELDPITWINNKCNNSSRINDSKVHTSTNTLTGEDLQSEKAKFKVMHDKPIKNNKDLPSILKSS